MLEIGPIVRLMHSRFTLYKKKLSGSCFVLLRYSVAYKSQNVKSKNELRHALCVVALGQCSFDSTISRNPRGSRILIGKQISGGKSLRLPVIRTSAFPAFAAARYGSSPDPANQLDLVEYQETQRSHAIFGSVSGKFYSTVHVLLESLPAQIHQELVAKERWYDCGSPPSQHYDRSLCTCCRNQYIAVQHNYQALDSFTNRIASSMISSSLFAATDLSTGAC